MRFDRITQTFLLLPMCAVVIAIGVSLGTTDVLGARRAIGITFYTLLLASFCSLVGVGSALYSLRSNVHLRSRASYLLVGWGALPVVLILALAAFALFAGSA